MCSTDARCMLITNRKQFLIPLPCQFGDTLKHERALGALFVGMLETYVWNSHFWLKLNPRERGKKNNHRPLKCVFVCVCARAHVKQGKNGHLSVEYLYVFLNMSTDINLHADISPLWVILVSVCWGWMCSKAAPTTNEPSRAESGTVLFHHHPHWGNVKPWGHCQSF